MSALRPRLLVAMYSHNTWGGIEFWITSLATYLQENGWDVRVGLARGLKYNLPGKFKQMHAELRTVEFDGRTGTTAGRIRAVSQVLSRLQPDILLPIGLSDAFAAGARAKRRGMDLRLVGAIRATSPEILTEMERLAPCLDMCIGNNPLHERYLAQRSVLPRDRICTIVNGVALPPPGWSRPARGSSVLRILFLGRLNQGHKRVLDLVELTTALRNEQVDFQLTIVGSGDERKELETRLSDCEREGRVRFLGFVPQEEIQREVLPANDVMIHLSPSEGCPQSVQQAMSYGVVPVCSEFLGARSLGFLEEGRTCCFFPIGDMSAAAESLKILYQRREEVCRLSVGARKRIREFTVEQSFGTWQSVLSSCLNIAGRVPTDANMLRIDQATIPGRLERWGLPRNLSDRIRHLFRRFPAHPDGWSEWPGTATALTEGARMQIEDELRAMDLPHSIESEFSHVTA